MLRISIEVATKMSDAEDFQIGPLTDYRSQATFDWKDFRFVVPMGQELKKMMVCFTAFTVFLQESVSH